MSKILIKNFGPIKEGYLEDDGWMDIKKVTVFIGNQGSGKSTVAKVISTLMWVEKALNRGDFPSLTSIEDFRRHFEYQGLKSYFRNDTTIEYDGDLYFISFNTKDDRYSKSVKKDNPGFIVPKIMYVPAERSFLSVIKNATGVRGLPEPLFEFAEELKRAQREVQDEEILLPINGVKYKYDEASDASFIIGADFNINLLIASSGFQSLVPLYLVSRNLTNVIKTGSEITPDNISVDQSIRLNKEITAIMLDNKLDDIEKIQKVNAIKARFQNRAFINIVEEPEQNLFPNSQHQILNCLLEFNNTNAGNKLIITTHSPYLINFLSIAIQGKPLNGKVKFSQKADELTKRLHKIVPLPSLVSSTDVVIYQLDENNGTITKLPSPEGIPSNKNYLNQSLRHGNELFDSLLELEQDI